MKPGISPRILEVLETAAKAMPASMALESAFDGGEAYTVEDQLRLGASLAETEADRGSLQDALRQLRASYRGLTARAAPDCVFVKNTKFYAYLTLLPLSGLGKSVMLEHLWEALAEAEVVKGIDRAAVASAYEKAAGRRELIWNLRVARGTLAERGADARLEFAVRVIDHRRLFGEAPGKRSSVRDMVEPVEPSRVLAKHVPSQGGKGGILVTGKKLPAPHGRELPFNMGGRLRLNEKTGDLVSYGAGCLVLARSVLDVVPVLQRDAADGSVWNSPERRIEHDGGVYLRGSVVGPGRIVARDAYVDGDLVDVDVQVEGDLWVGGTLSSPSGAGVRSGGRVQARNVDRVLIDALGPVTVLEEARGSRIRSADSVQLGADGRGAVLSGELEAMNRVTVGTAGSEPGPGVTLIAGSSRLAEERIEELGREDRRREERLAELAREKERVLGSILGEAVLAPDRQHEYREIVRREGEELKARRVIHAGRERLRALAQSSGPARVEVLKRFLPPGRVRVGPAEIEMNAPLEASRFALGADGRVEVASLRATTRTQRIKPGS